MFAEDLSIFTNPAEFGDVATATTRFGEVVTLPVIFDNGYDPGNVGMLNMASTQPMLLCQSAQLPAGEPVGLEFTIAGTRYTVAAAEPDGTGLTRLMLERVA